MFVKNLLTLNVFSKLYINIWKPPERFACKLLPNSASGLALLPLSTQPLTALTRILAPPKKVYRALVVEKYNHEIPVNIVLSLRILLNFAKHLEYFRLCVSKLIWPGYSVPQHQTKLVYVFIHVHLAFIE